LLGLIDYDEVSQMAKVLIIDDDVVLRDFLKASLTQDGYDVRTAGSQANVRRDRYDAVLSEIERPFSLDKLQSRLKHLGVTDAA
jgi:DNA-binding NtrC family response regulator